MACTIKESSTLVDVHGKSPSCRRRWSAKDDRLLRNYYVKYKGSWSRIAKELPGRDNRACYNRWINHANPDVNKQPLEKWEIDILKENYKYYGNQWNLVIKGLKGRTPLQAKNFFYSMRKSSEKLIKERMSIYRIVNKDHSSESNIPESFMTYFIENNVP